jgi:hypothetical protein
MPCLHEFYKSTSTYVNWRQQMSEQGKLTWVKMDITYYWRGQYLKKFLIFVCLSTDVKTDRLQDIDKSTV